MDVEVTVVVDSPQADDLEPGQQEGLSHLDLRAVVEVAVVVEIPRERGDRCPSESVDVDVNLTSWPLSGFAGVVVKLATGAALPPIMI